MLGIAVGSNVGEIVGRNSISMSYVGNGVGTGAGCVDEDGSIDGPGLVLGDVENDGIAVGDKLLLGDKDDDGVVVGEGLMLG